MSWWYFLLFLMQAHIHKLWSTHDGGIFSRNYASITPLAMLFQGHVMPLEWHDPWSEVSARSCIMALQRLIFYAKLQHRYHLYMAYHFTAHPTIGNLNGFDDMAQSLWRSTTYQCLCVEIYPVKSYCIMKRYLHRFDARGIIQWTWIFPFATMNLSEIIIFQLLP